jgi:hypothetical protein
MTLLVNVQPGSLVFLECGCNGYRMRSLEEGPVLIIVERPCATHGPDGRPQLRYVDPFESASAFGRDRGGVTL